MKTARRTWQAVMAPSVHVKSQEPCSSDIELTDRKDINEEILSLKGLFILLLSICYNRHFIKKLNNFNGFMHSNSTKNLII